MQRAGARVGVVRKSAVLFRSCAGGHGIKQGYAERIARFGLVSLIGLIGET